MPLGIEHDHRDQGIESSAAESDLWFGQAHQRMEHNDAMPVRVSTASTKGKRNDTGAEQRRG